MSSWVPHSTTAPRPTEAVRGWLPVDEQDRPALVAEHHRRAGSFDEPVVQQRVRGTWRADPLWAVWARRAG